MASDLFASMSALQLESEPDFPKWFWTGTNGNGLIKKLNNYASSNNIPDRIRRETEFPAVYAVVVNDFLSTKNWRLVKVGFTHQSIKKGINNRMENLVSKIERLNDRASAATLFALRIGSVDTTPYYDTEERIRNKVGIPIKKAKAKELELPVPTEWVLTTQRHINKIQELKKAALREGRDDVIDIFKDIRALDATELPESLKNWVEEKEK